MSNLPRRIKMEEGWASLQRGITKLKNLLDGGPEFTPEEHMSMYTTAYDMCSPLASHDYLRQMLERYKGIFPEYISATVLPALREQHDELLLKELVKRWGQYKIFVRRLSSFFNILDRVYISGRSTGTVSNIGLLCFRDQVYAEVKYEVRDAAIALIDREREGEQIDQALLKNVLGVFVEVGMGKMDSYENDFEAAMLADTAAYYSRKAASWFEQDSYSDSGWRSV